MYITAPAGATHFRIILCIGTISDYLYNTATKKYEPAAPVLNSLSATIYSPYLPLTAAAADQALIADLPGTPTLTAQVSVVACLGIQFSQLIGTVQYPLAEHNAMKIVSLF